MSGTRDTVTCQGGFSVRTVVTRWIQHTEYNSRKPRYRWPVRWNRIPLSRGWGMYRSAYEEEKAIITEARCILRRTFVEGELETIPECRVINGLEYKNYDDQLIEQERVLESKWLMSRVNYAQKQGQRKEEARVVCISEGRHHDPPAFKYHVVCDGAMKSAPGCDTSAGWKGRSKFEL